MDMNIQNATDTTVTELNPTIADATVQTPDTPATTSFGTKLATGATATIGFVSVIFMGIQIYEYIVQKRRQRKAIKEMRKQAEEAAKKETTKAAPEDVEKEYPIE